MNVMVVSQCSRNALKETRRILDQFAERRGDRTWQTAITKDGLDTLRRLLRKTARRNTAVACHWVRGKNHSELLWIVGKADEFNSQGAVPTNTTGHDILRLKTENDWHGLNAIRMLSAMAALFHDFGKANSAFQAKLKHKGPAVDPIRHEWISLRLLEAFVNEDSDDQAWLQRLAEGRLPAQIAWTSKLQMDTTTDLPPSPFKKLPPLAAAIGWLIVSHHRFPTDRSKGRRSPNPTGLKHLPSRICAGWCGAQLELADMDATETKACKACIGRCWTFDHPFPAMESAWINRAQKLARRLTNHISSASGHWLDDYYVMHISRLVLMLADHHYSSLPPVESAHSRTDNISLYANTCRDTGSLNQSLVQHLLGVEEECGHIAHTLPRLETDLPRLARHKGFKRRSTNPRYRWQDQAYDLACSIRKKTVEHGFFGVNMASTGCGKTLANGRIMYALASPERGARFTMALGLRTLTLQTGEAYRTRMGLGLDDLAVLVGGGAVRELAEKQTILNAHSQSGGETRGGESDEGLFPEDTYVHYEGSLDDGPVTEWLKKTHGAAALVNAPVLACTIDHLMPATESLRGGHQIAPMLRLMSADLVLDEPDDFSPEDLYGLSRLVHLAGTLGTRLMLSSATLPPAMVEGLFDAYCSGRAIYQKNCGIPGLPLHVCCAWFDESGCTAEQHASRASFADRHRQWVEKRVKKLNAAAPRRRARIAPVFSDMTPGSAADITGALARTVSQTAADLHKTHHTQDPKSSKLVSFGLVRMAHIDALIDVVRALSTCPPPTETHLHLCCYHSRHPLLIRSEIERILDRLLVRHQPLAVFEDRDIRRMIDAHPAENHLFIVLASPVAEVGRDHDYDWAIVEPSSMRSIIQLAGRVQRHRESACTSENIVLLGTNVASLLHPDGQPTYCRPGFETKTFPLASHKLADLLTPEQIEGITSGPRILERAELHPQHNLADLEHEYLRCVMADGSQNDRRAYPAAHWWTSRAYLSGELQYAFPFRYDPIGSEDYCLYCDEEEQTDTFTRIEHDGSMTPVEHLRKKLPFEPMQNISMWGAVSYGDQLEAVASMLDMDRAACSRRFGRISLPVRGADNGWLYDPALGFRRNVSSEKKGEGEHD
jgi:CRISPR-associated endonuclease/helicase Cas3